MNHIDALRGSVMLLLVPYHGLLFLQNTGQQMPGLDLSVFWLHLWRMGLFFAVSGFLAAMTIGLWGPAKQARQRLRRIAIPLAVAMVTVLPAQKLIVFWFYHQTTPGPGKPRFDYTFGNLFGWQPHHLWFLSYVLAFNLVAIAVWLVVRRRKTIGGYIDRGFRRLVASPLLVPVLAAASALPLWLGGHLEAPGQVAASLVPLPSAFAYYGIFFVFGWLLWRSRDMLGAVEGSSLRKLLVAIPAAVAAYALYSRNLEVPGFLPVGPTILFVSGIAVWTTLFAVWGLFARFLAGARPWVRYLADASYWIYLIHIPFLVLFQLALAGTGLPPLLRLVIATGSAIGLSLVTYALLVRHSPIGGLLHGKRLRKAAEPPATVPDLPLKAIPDSRLA